MTASGYCGDNGNNVTWSLDDTGTLTISGSSEMADYDYAVSINPQWDAYLSSITSVVIDDGVTSIGNHAFFSCINLTNIEIPDSVTSIGTREPLNK